MTTLRDAPGFRTFLVLWSGQLVSVFGSGLTSFALGVWVYQQSGSATQFGLLTFCAVVPAILTSLLAGGIVDRWDRRRILIVSDSVAACGSLALAALVWSGNLELWHVYAVVVVTASASAFQMPAFTASVPLLVPKQHLGRTAGLTQLGAALPAVAAPLLAGALVGAVGLKGILLIDLSTFLVAVAALLAVRIPNPSRRTETGEKQPLWRGAAFGWTYLRERPGLFALLLMFAGINFSLGILRTLMTPMVLSFASAATLGMVMSIASCGMLAGSVVMSVWGGPKRRIHGIFGFAAILGLILFLGGLRPSTLLVSSAAFVFLFCFPLINGCSAAVWQTKIAPDVLGRTTAVQRVIAMSALPLASLIAGPLAEYVFEPLLTAGGPLAGTVGRFVGVGPGRGIGLLFMVLGILILAALALGYSNPRLRNLEDEVPDVIPDQPTPAPAAAMPESAPGSA